MVPVNVFGNEPAITPTGFNNAHGASVAVGTLLTNGGDHVETAFNGTGNPPGTLTISQQSNVDSQTNLRVVIPASHFANTSVTALSVNLRHAYVWPHGTAAVPSGISAQDRVNAGWAGNQGGTWNTGSGNNPFYPNGAPLTPATNTRAALPLNATTVLPDGNNPVEFGVQLVSATRGDSSTAVIEVIRNNNLNSLPAGTNLEFILPIRGLGGWQNGDNPDSPPGAWMRIFRVMDGVPQASLINQSLIGAGARTVGWSVTGGARGFSSSLHVPPIRISENHIGALTNLDGRMHVMLTAPAFYSWSFAHPGGVGMVSNDITFGRTGLSEPLEVRAGGAGYGASFTNTTAAPNRGGSNVQLGIGPVWGTRNVAAGATHADGRHRIYIPINTFGRNLVFGTTGWIELRNLWLVPDSNAASVGDVRIDVQVGRLTAGGTATAPVSTVNAVVAHNTSLVVTSAMVGSPIANAVNAAFRNNDVGAANGATVGSTVEIFFITPSNTHSNQSLVNAVTGATVTGAPDIPVTANTNVMVNSTVNNWTVNNWVENLEYLGHPILNAGQRDTLHVGTRGNASLTAEVHEVFDIRAGHLGNFRAQNFVHPTGEYGRPTAAQQADTSNWRWNRDNEGTAYHQGVMTGTLVIEETIPGGFSTGFGTPINFEFLDDEGGVHPGIRILGMEARAGNFRTGDWNRGELNNFWGGQEGIAGPGSVVAGGSDIGPAAWRNSNQNWMTFRGWVSAIDQRMPNVANVGRISDLGATLYLPSQNIHEVNPNVPNHHNNGILEVRFWLSVEAGFEWKYGSNIDVTISGAGVANLPESERVVTVAHARDAIQLNLVDGVTAVETGTLYNIVGGVQPVSDVVIDVVDNSAFAIGEELWIYVGTDTIGRNFDINLVNIPTVEVVNQNESGLRLDTGRLMSPAAAGHVGRAGVAFTVTRQPYGGDAPAPVIRISNLNVEGQAFPGVDYQIIVSGTGIANNDQEVFNALRLANRPHITQPVNVAGIAQSAAIAPMSRGVFTSLPFNETVLENVFGGVWDTAPEPAPLPPAVVGPVEHRLWAGMHSIAGVDDPFRWVDTPNTNPPLRVGFLSARAFGYIINGSPEVGVEWNEATNTATISGEDVHGNQITVVMTVGSNIAQVNGAPTDIAALAGHSGPDGSIQVVPTPDGRIFLPIRFLTTAFGRTVSAEGEVVIIR